MTRAKLLVATGIFTAVVLAACERIVVTPPISTTVRAEVLTTHELGRQIYNFRCYFCHGYSGDAQTLAATFLKPAPRSFKASSPGELSREQIINAITYGRAGTAMKSFSGTIAAGDITAVADFILEEFTRSKAHNTRYHTEANGWSDHERFKIAFPFATGEIALDESFETMSSTQRQGKQLFMSACISCHDRAKINREGPAWAIRPVTYPPDFYLLSESGRAKEHSEFDPHHAHEKPPVFRDLSGGERRGEHLFQRNCAFCHAADGTGRNWIGSFLEPNAADLTSPQLSAKNKLQLAAIITEGIDGTSMPAWKHVLTKADIDAVAAFVARAFLNSGNTRAQRP